MATNTTAKAATGSAVTTSTTQVPKQGSKKAATPAKKYTTFDLDKATWHRDPTTVKGERAMVTMTVGQWLTSMGVYRDGTFDSKRIHTTEVQRTILAIGGTSKKASMMRHVIQGGPVPGVIMMAWNGGLTPLDGLQRADVHAQVAQALLAIKHDPQAAVSPWLGLATPAVEAIRKVTELGHKVTDVDSFLEGLIAVEIWRGLSEQEQERKFGAWNLDQNQISTKHMAEIMHSSLRERLNAIGIKTQTEKEKKTPVLGADGLPVKAPRKSKNDPPTPPKDVVRELAGVQVALLAYLTASRVADKTSLLEERAAGRIHDKWEQFGDDVVAADMGWFYLSLLPALHLKYDNVESAVPKQIKSESETFTTPFLAALGYARQEKVDPALIQAFKDSVMHELGLNTADPLGLFMGADSWADLADSPDLKGSAGQKARKLHYYGTRHAILNGLPFNWEKALRDAQNA